MKHWFKKSKLSEPAERRVKSFRAIALPSLCPGDHLVIGREADIVAGKEDHLVSRRHATFRRLDSGEYQIIDGAMQNGEIHPSSNGVYIALPGGEWTQVQGFAIVPTSTVIRLGANTFVEVPPDTQGFQIDL